MREKKQMEEADGDAMCYKVIERERKRAIHTIVQKQKKARFKKERKRTLNAVKIIEVTELHLNW